jgi:hypothetical protein
MSAAYDIGYAAETGIGVVQDPQEAARWYSKAAEQGDTQAEDRLVRVLGDAPGAAEREKAKQWIARTQALRSARAAICSAPSIAEAMRQVDEAILNDPERLVWQTLASMMTGVGLDVSARLPFRVKVSDASVRYGGFMVDPLQQAGDFLCQGFFGRGDDQFIALLDENDIAALTRRRAETFDSATWHDLNDAISSAELAQEVSSFMNQQMKAHGVYAEHFIVRPLERGRYRVIEINVPLRNSHFADVDGPPLEAPK